MPPSFNFFWIKQNPEYKKGYTEGFEDAKRMYEKRLKAIIKEAKGIEPFATSTTTATTDLSEGDKK